VLGSPRPPQGLSGGAIASATATGTLTTGIPLAGNATALVTGAGGLTTAIRLSGAAVAVCNATGNLIVSGGLSAVAVRAGDRYRHTVHADPIIGGGGPVGAGERLADE
jgi:hypothetical protein